MGSTVLEVAHANKIEIEGACGGECACSTCHVIVDDESFEKLPELELEEEDMLDLAAEVTDTSVTTAQGISQASQLAAFKPRLQIKAVLSSDFEGGA